MQPARNTAQQIEDLSNKLNSITDNLTKAQTYLRLAQLHDDLGALSYSEQIIKYTTAAISLNASPRINNTALRLRATVREAIGKAGAALEDLQQACSEAERLTHVGAGNIIPEEDRAEASMTFFDYGNSLILAERYTAAVTPLMRALSLAQPVHKPRVVYLIIRAQNNGNVPENIFLAIRNSSLSLKDVNDFIIGNKLPALCIQAARLGWLPQLEYLEANGISFTTIDNEGNNALHHAAMAGRIEVVDFLSRYLDINGLNKAGMSPLLLAGAHGRVAMVEALIAKGAQITVNNKTLFSVAIEAEQGCVLESLLNNQVFCKMLLAHTADIANLYQVAIEAKKLDMLKILVKLLPQGLNLLSTQGYSPLHYAIKHDFVNAIYFLIAQGADISQATKNNQTCQQLASTHSEQILHYLNNTEIRLKTELELLEGHKQVFIGAIIKELTEQLPDLWNLWERDVHIQENTSRISLVIANNLSEGLARTIFLDEPYLADLLKKQLLNSIVKAPKITEWQMFGPDKIDKTTLNAIVEAVINSPWQIPTEAMQEADVKIAASDNLSPKQVLFCERFERQFDEAFGLFRGINSGDVVSKKDMEEAERLRKIESVAARLPDISTPAIPGIMPSFSVPVGSVAIVAIELALYLRQKYRLAEAQRMVQVFDATTPYERAYFVRYTAEQLAYKYANQINHLMAGSEGVEQFADCTVARIVEFIISNDSHQVAHSPGVFARMARSIKSWALTKEIPPEQQQQKALYDIFLDGIIRVTSRFPKDAERLRTINNLTLEDQWSAKGIFENTGIIIEDGQRYSHPNVDLARYGYCKGSILETEKRHLTSRPKKGELWGMGRIWEAEGAVAPLSPLSAAGAAMLPGYQAGASVRAVATSPSSVHAVAASNADDDNKGKKKIKATT